MFSVRRRRVIGQATSVAFLVLAGLLGVPDGAASLSAGAAGGYQVLFSVGVDDKGVHYWQEAGQQAWGPSALAVADDGRLGGLGPGGTVQLEDGQQPTGRGYLKRGSGDLFAWD